MSVLGQQEILRLFHENLLKFLDNLVKLLPKEQDLIVLRIMFRDQIPLEQAMEIFCNRILPHKEKIIKRDESFFIENSDLFEGLAHDKVHYFKNIWLSPTFDQDDKDAMWSWFKLFLTLAIQYKPYL